MVSVLPSLVVSDGQGKVFYLEEYKAVGISGETIKEIPEDEWIPLPYGSQLMELPGFTDQPDEIEALESLIRNYNIDMIQWRNLNIDPELYWEEMNPLAQDGIGIKKMIEYFRGKFPYLKHGYFTPS